MAHNFPSWNLDWSLFELPAHNHTWNFVLLLSPLPGIRPPPDPFLSFVDTSVSSHEAPLICQDPAPSVKTFSVILPLEFAHTPGKAPHIHCVCLRSDPLSYPHLHAELTDQRLVSITLSPLAQHSGLFLVSVYCREIELNEAAV